MANKKTSRRALILSAVSLILCLAMLTGTTFAWFTDNVTTGNNIIKSGNLDADLEYKNHYSEGYYPAADATIFDYDLWEPGYTQIKYVKVSNTGNLAFRYQVNIIPTMYDETTGVNLADVIDVYMILEPTAEVTRADLTAANRVGTLSELMADGDGAAYGVLLPVSGSANVTLNAEDVALAQKGDVEICIALKMQESAGNEYKALEVNGGFTVQLLATQYTWENDSFDNSYDTGADFLSTPLAKVRKITPPTMNIWTLSPFANTNVPVTLDTAYVFEATETEEEAAAGPYAGWHADFVISFDKPVAAGTAGLGGDYGLFNNIAFLAPTDLAADTEYRLLYDAAGLFLGYDEVCSSVKTFTCGAFDVNGQNAGTTMTVELRLYETNKELGGNSLNNINCETGEYIVVGRYTYTFGNEVNTADELAAVLAAGGEAVLANDLTLADSALSVPSGKEVVLDLNGHTLTVSNSNAAASCAIDNKGDLTIKGGTITYKGVGDPSFGYGTNTITNSGNLVIDGATVINTTNSGSSNAIDNAPGSTLVVNSGTIKSEKVTIRVRDGANVTINGGTISGTRAVQVHLFQGTNADTKLTINGGTFNGTELALYSYAYGNVKFDKTTIKIAGGTFNGDVCFGGGNKEATETVEITGGTFNGELGRYLANDGWEDVARP